MTRRTGGLLAPGRGPASLALAGIFGAAVFLATLALALGLAVKHTAFRWDAAIAGRLTVQIAPDAAGRAEALVASLRGVRGVAAASVVPDAESRALLSPWLGAAVSELPLPRLVDLRVDAVGLDREELRRRVASLPGAALDDGDAMLAPLRRAAGAVAAGATIAAATLAGLALLAATLAARAGLAAQSDVVELLHLIGATDAYVAGRFARLVARAAALGGSLGFAAAILTIWLAAGSVEAASGSLVPALTLPERLWLWLPLVPVVIGVAAVATAFQAALAGARRLP